MSPAGKDVRPAIIAAAEQAALLLIAPLLVAYRAGILSYYSAGQVLSLVPGAVGLLVRRAWYRATLAACGRNLGVQFGTVIHKANSRIGNDCYFGEFNRVGMVDIGNDFMSSNNVSIMSGRRQHAFDRRDIPVRAQQTTYDRVTIGDDVWVGVQATIAADVASHSIVATGAVVTASHEEWQILGGVPAKVLGERP
jgi:acetyltransferase-like isoleucine patch superfamily enzyme